MKDQPQMTQRRLFLTVLALLFAAPALAQSTICANFTGPAAVAPQPERVEGASSHVYKSVNGVDLRVHAFGSNSSGQSRRPTLVFFFGGGWNRGEVTQFREEAAYFAGRGMQTILVEYRTFCREGVSVVDEVEDAKSAIRWIRIHADELGVDPSMIAAVGASAGGHLALSTAMFDDLDNPDEDRTVSSRPDLLLLFYPCVDLTLEAEMEFSSEVIGPHGYDVSPLFHIPPDLPPLIVFQGTADPLYASGTQFCDEVGSRCEYVEYAGAGHGYLNRRSSDEEAWADDTLRGMERFLTEAAYLDGE